MLINYIMLTECVVDLDPLGLNKPVLSSAGIPICDSCKSEIPGKPYTPFFGGFYCNRDCYETSIVFNYSGQED